MNSKKLIAMLLAVLMIVALAVPAMADGEEEAEEEKEPVVANEKYKIALIQQHQDNAFQITVSEAAQAKAEELGIELTILSANQDAATQISQIEQCVAEDFDAILYEPVNPDALGDASKAAVDEGVVVINIISAVTDWQDYGISAISLGDNVTAGEAEMQHV